MELDGPRPMCRWTSTPETNIEHIYAIGDITGQHLLAHYASHMGLTAVTHALGEKEARVTPECVPSAVFVDPELAWVGLTEAQARKNTATSRPGASWFGAWAGPRPTATWTAWSRSWPRERRTPWWGSISWGPNPRL